MNSVMATFFFEALADAMSFVKEGREDTIFVGGLRKSTIEDKVAAHFAKFGQVTSVEIKKQPDGTSRGFCFVTFADKAMSARNRGRSWGR